MFNLHTHTHTDSEQKYTRDFGVAPNCCTLPIVYPLSLSLSLPLPLPLPYSCPCRASLHTQPLATPPVAATARPCSSRTYLARKASCLSLGQTNLLAVLLRFAKSILFTLFDTRTLSHTQMQFTEYVHKPPKKKLRTVKKYYFKQKKKRCLPAGALCWNAAALVCCLFQLLFAACNNNTHATTHTATTTREQACANTSKCARSWCASIAR